MIDAQKAVEETIEELDDLNNALFLRVAAIRDPAEMTIEYCGRVMADLKTAYEKAEELHKIIGVQYRHYQQFIMPKRMHELGEEVTKFAVKGLGTFTLTPDFHISILASKKEEAKIWLTENNMGDLITETVNASSLKASSKKYFKEHGEFPDAELFKSYTFEFVKLTKR